MPTIRELRQTHGWTQQQLAKRIGVSPAAVHHWEQGLSRPTPGHLVELARVFSVAPGGSWEQAVSTEAISETFSTKQRGRPPLMDGETRRLYRNLYPDDGPRSLLNRHYQAVAMRVLGLQNSSQEYAWLTTPRLRLTTITELGRIGDAEVIRMVARHICDKQLQTTAATGAIRRIRRSAPTTNYSALAMAIRRAIDRHVAKHPATSKTDILQALGDIGQGFER